MTLDFTDTETAFAHSSDAELRFSYWLFKAMSFDQFAYYMPRLTNICFKLKLPIKPIVKKSVFSHFCGGESIGECSATIQKLSESQVCTILDYGSEATEDETAFEKTVAETEHALEMAKKDRWVPFCVFKPTGVGSIKLMAKVSEGVPLTSAEESEVERIRIRISRLFARAADLKVPLFLDAEESWIQGFVDECVEQAMALHNTESPVVFTTVQMYRKDRLAYLEGLVERARKGGYKIGVKLVRGAYLEKENARAAKLGIDSPLHPSKEATDEAYDSAVRLIISNLDIASVCIGTHNEYSTRLTSQLMAEHGYSPTDDRVFFAQLLGMSNHLTFNLAKFGHNVAKYVPYGPVSDVLPYLARRAEENVAVRGQTTRELGLIRSEIERRNQSK